jgi:hypothetical protein
MKTILPSSTRTVTADVACSGGGDNSVISIEEQQIRVRHLALKYDGLVNQDLVNKLSQYCMATGIGHWMLTRDGHVLLSCNGYIRLSKGVKSLADQLGLLQLKRVPMNKPAPDTLIRKLFPMGVDEASILARMGEKYTDMAINAIAKIHVTKAKNAKIDACKDAKQAVDEDFENITLYNTLKKRLPMQS